MRISDWSSDVCSSDLDQVHRVAKGLGNRYHPAVVGAVEVGETVQAAAGEEALAGAGRIVSLHGGGEQLRQILAGIFKHRARYPARLAIPRGRLLPQCPLPPAPPPLLPLGPPLLLPHPVSHLVLPPPFVLFSLFFFSFPLF